MIGFETTGNATVTVFDNETVLTTDPWDGVRKYLELKICFLITWSSRSIRRKL